MARMITPELPGLSWTEDAVLRTPQGGKLRRWGSVREACKMLGNCDRETLYRIVDSGLVRGYKLRPDVRNSHRRVDLLSVWEHKQRQMAR
jgi:hypothetical protein